MASVMSPQYAIKLPVIQDSKTEGQVILSAVCFQENGIEPRQERNRRMPEQGGNLEHTSPRVTACCGEKRYGLIDLDYAGF
jgi:hypothetical protein